MRGEYSATSTLYIGKSYYYAPGEGVAKAWALANVIFNFMQSRGYVGVALRS